MMRLNRDWKGYKQLVDKVAIVVAIEIIPLRGGV